MKVYLGADHRGFELKEKIKEWLVGWGVGYEDMGNKQLDIKDDYPDYALKVGKAVGKSNSKGIVICGSGVGVNIAVNKVNGARSVLGFDVEQVKHGVEYDQANVLSLAADYFNEKKAKMMIDVFLKTEYGKQERNIRRVEKIKKIEAHQKLSGLSGQKD